MYKTLLFLCLFLIASQTYSQHEVLLNQLRDVDGQMYLDANTEPYTGKCIAYHNNGKTSIESRYMQGKLHGIENAYFISGEIYMKSSFVNGKYNGIVTTWYENGKTRSEELYREDYKNGHSKYFHMNGNKESAGSFVNCYEHGLWKYWNEDGSLKKEVFYNMGEEINPVSETTTSSDTITKRNKNNSIQDAIDKLNNDTEMQNASWGVCIMSSKSGNVIGEHNSSQSLIPASVMKAVTSSTILSILGKNYRFETVLEHDGTIDSAGTLHGNLYIRGGGDPTFGSDRFDNLSSFNNIFNKWHKAIISKGIKKINGSVVADASIFDEELIPRSWSYGDIGNYYGAGACGLNFNENYYHLYFRPSLSVGQQADYIKTDPETPDLNIINQVTTASSRTGDNVYILGSPYSNTRILTGTVPWQKKPFKVKGASPDPSYSCAWLFNKFINDNTIKTRDKPSSIRKMALDNKLVNLNNRTTITTHYSPSLDTIIYWTNIKSINTYAESMLKMIGHKLEEKGSTNKGAEATKEFWKKKGVDMTGFVMKDGSGLSRVNNITTRQLTEILLYTEIEDTGKTFYNSLPIAGRTGSIKKYFNDSFAENNLRAKTGSMWKIKSYCGYVTTRSGEVLVFSIITNYYNAHKNTMRHKIEELLIKVAETE